MIWRVFKITGWIIAGLLIIELLFYFTAPVYDFQPSQPFSGEKIHNPYAGMDSSHWRKSNFHFHLRAWGGLTSGRNNTTDEFWKTYKKLGYTASYVSDYMRINTFNKDSVFYIPVYEHGIGIRKKHQILIGAEKVLWFDYSLVQNLNHKQHILNLLRNQNEIVAIAHPDWEAGYSLDDMKLLSNYDLLEVLDNNWRSVPQWDVALSSGHPVYILADDDAHDISNPYQIGRCCTYINSPTLHSADLVKALKEGKSFGAEIYMSEGETFDQKAFRAEQVPTLESVEIRNDTLFVRADQKAFKFNFVGQNGKSMKLARYTSSAWYRILPEDTYIRTEITFFNQYGGPGTVFYLNPVFRSKDENPGNPLRAEINYPRTWILRLFSIPALAALIFFWFNMRRRKKNQKQSGHEG
ncbi:MAG: hypothetical protein NTU98_10425 [Bacteroidetes bacterium]|nr:hypothetical protein [Bacteroidota bacterium]